MIPLLASLPALSWVRSEARSWFSWGWESIWRGFLDCYSEYKSWAGKRCEIINIIAQAIANTSSSKTSRKLMHWLHKHNMHPEKSVFSYWTLKKKNTVFGFYKTCAFISDIINTFHPWTWMLITSIICLCYQKKFMIFISSIIKK